MSAQTDPVVVASEIYKLVMENERVRVLEVVMPPGAASPPHAHPDAVWYLLSPAKLAFTASDGAVFEGEFPAGAVWREAETHAAKNISPSEMRAIAIELK